MHKQKKEIAIKLRLQGKSYNEIRKLLNLPSKGTLSHWFKDIQLTATAKKKLESKMQLARKRGLFDFNRKRTEKVLLENSQIFEQAKKDVGIISERDLFIIGTALYWGEGYKSRKHPKMSFTNSDPAMVRLFLKFMRRTLKIPDDKIRTHIHIHPNLDIQNAIKFWSNITSIKPDNFRIIKQTSIASHGRRPVNILPHGTLDVRVNSRQLYFKMMGLIEGLCLNIG